MKTFTLNFGPYPRPTRVLEIVNRMEDELGPDYLLFVRPVRGEQVAFVGIQIVRSKIAEIIRTELVRRETSTKIEDQSSFVHWCTFPGFRANEDPESTAITHHRAPIKQWHYGSTSAFAWSLAVELPEGVVLSPIVHRDPPRDCLLSPALAAQWEMDNG